MQNLINYWLFIFWTSLILFISNLTNIIKLLLYSEIIWIIFYCYIIILGSVNDDINLISSSFFILAFAGLEYSIGLLIIILYKNINNTIFTKNKNINFISNKNLFNI